MSEIDYKKVDFVWGGTLDDAYNLMEKYKEDSVFIKGEFNGHELLSDKINSIDDLYRQVTGLTKKEFKSYEEKLLMKIQDDDKKHKEQFSQLTKYWQQRGREVLNEDKWEYWDEIVPIRLKDLYKGAELGNCLEIVEALNCEVSFEKIKEILDEQRHSGTSYALVLAMVKEFSDKGKELIEFLNS